MPLGKQYAVLHSNSGNFVVVGIEGKVYLSDSDIGSLAIRLKREQREGRLKDGSIVTGEPVLRDSPTIHGLTPEEHSTFWRLYSSKTYVF